MFYKDIDLRVVKAWMRGIGIVATLIGVMALPLGMGVSPKRDTSFFANLADTGTFIKFSFFLLGVGIVLLIVSILIGADDQDR